jgi:protein-tyrosine-phosphatase/tRNA A37 threonylcarbamoyladenosine synthetase subunit TsaC/SUA5/YrdC
MPEVFDWQSVADPCAVVRRAVETLRAGGVVAFPMESGYHLAASGLSPAAVAVLGEGRSDDPAAPLPLAVLGAAEARDWAPGLGSLALRLARRCWPGPLILECGPSEGVGDGLAGQLPDAVRRAVCLHGKLHLRCPAHEAVLATLEQLAGPLILAPTQCADACQVVRNLGERAAVVVDDGPTTRPQPTTVIQVQVASWKVIQQGAVSEEALRRQSACLVVFVCTGNTCRSPLAEALCKARLAERLGCAAEELPERGFQVLSAGLAAMSGGPAALEAVEVAQAYHADLTGHRSRPLTPDLAAQADYLIAMTHSHLTALCDGYFGLAAEPRLLNPDGADLADPIGCPLYVYEECARQIWSSLEPLMEELQTPASNAPPNS